MAHRQLHIGFPSTVLNFPEVMCCGRIEAEPLALLLPLTGTSRNGKGAGAVACLPMPCPS